jgi:hypothetical protein
MSSQFSAVCLAHDPAIEIGPEYPDATELYGAWRDHTGGFTQHKGCRVRFLRYSGGLVEVGCPPLEPEHAWHRDVRWVDANWLRIAWAARICSVALSHPQLWRADQARKFLGRMPDCWDVERVLTRMTGLLGLDEGVPEDLHDPLIGHTIPAGVTVLKIK